MKIIGVVVATYNGGTFLEEQIESIVNQSLPPREIIVVDDGSKDGTHEIIGQYVARSPEKFVFIRNEKNPGAKGAFERGAAVFP
jgi:glycosyltransferase involved in cell wall biosynthesis